MKKRVLIHFNNLPDGYANSLVSFFGKDKQLISALPYETEDVYYMVKIPVNMDAGEDESKDDTPADLPGKQSLDEIEDEKYLVQEEADKEFE